MKDVTPVYIEDISGELVTGMQAAILEIIKDNELAALGATLIQQIRFSHSSFDELVETLAQADGGGAEKYRKYPLVHLVQDVTVTRGEDVGLFGSAPFVFILVHQTDNKYKIEDRDAKVFKPVLWPMYYELLRQIHLSNWFFFSAAATGEFKHTVTKRAFWGNRKLEGGANTLNDFVDAIEVRITSLKINYTNC